MVWPASPGSLLPVSAKTVASAPSSKTTSVRPKSTRPSDIADNRWTGRSRATPRGTYSTCPPDQQAVCKEANLS